MLSKQGELGILASHFQGIHSRMEKTEKANARKPSAPWLSTPCSSSPSVRVRIFKEELQPLTVQKANGLVWPFGRTNVLYYSTHRTTAHVSLGLSGRYQCSLMAIQQKLPCHSKRDQYIPMGTWFPSFCTVPFFPAHAVVPAACFWSGAIHSFRAQPKGNQCVGKLFSGVGRKEGWKCLTLQLLA